MLLIPAAAIADGEDVTISVCLAEVARQSGEAAVTISKDFSEANSLVLVGAGPDGARWRCLVSNDGRIAELSQLPPD